MNSPSKHVRLDGELVAIAADIAGKIPQMSPRLVIEFMIRQMGPQMLAALERRQVEDLIIEIDSEAITVASEGFRGDRLAIAPDLIEKVAEDLANA